MQLKQVLIAAAVGVFVIVVGSLVYDKVKASMAASSAPVK